MPVHEIRNRRAQKGGRYNFYLAPVAHDALVTVAEQCRVSQSSVVDACLIKLLGDATPAEVIDLLEETGVLGSVAANEARAELAADGAGRADKSLPIRRSTGL